MNTPSKQAHQKELFGHPIGLYVLFFTEMWERFSYYGMRAILVLYLIARTGNMENPALSGLGWDEKSAYALYGWYTMLVYIMSIPGGIIADKWLGQKRAVKVGAILLVFGHGILAVEQYWAFYSGLILIILGVGMLKPNISTMVGGLYKESDIRRDKGFTIFYIGINLGAFLASIIVGLIGENYGWHYGFGLAGIGMLFGFLQYQFGQKYLTHVGNKPNAQSEKETVDIGQLFRKLLVSEVQLIVFIILLIASFVIPILKIPTDKIGYIFLFIFISFVVALMMMIYKELNTQVQKDRYLVLLLSFVLVIVFWGAFEQAGGLMNVYTKTNTDRFVSLFTYSYEIPASWFQSLNPLFIMIFGTFVALYWAKVRLQKSHESSSLFKMAVGTVIMGLGFVFMVFATMEYESSGKSAMYWLILAYLFHTIGELCTSPVVLSFITKLAPLKYSSLLMGVYFAATGLGNKLAGILGESSSEHGERSVFLGIAEFTVLFALLVIAILKPLKRLTHGVEDNERDLSTSS